METSPIMIPSPVVVTGQLVEEPNVKLAKWTKVLALIYFIHSLYVCIQYILSHTSGYQWLTFCISTFTLVIWLPLCGHQASKKPGSGRLALFSGAQGFLGCWYLFSIVSLWMFIMAVISACQTCESTFKVGNETCTVDTDMNRTIEITSRTCSKTWPSIEHFAATLLLLFIALASFTAAVLARKTVKSKTMHVITVSSIPVLNTVEAPLVPPEDSVA